MNWTSWTPCSQTCGPQARRHRSRSYIEGRHGGEKSGKLKEPSEEVDYCLSSKDTTIKSNWGSCPVNARHGEWGDWNPVCPNTCYNEGSLPPTKTRIRVCETETLSDNPEFNKKVIRCANGANLLPEIKEKETCPGSRLCPGENARF